jgi:hypothetical protein
MSQHHGSRPGLERPPHLGGLAEAEGVCLGEFLKHMLDVCDEASRKR